MSDPVTIDRETLMILTEWADAAMDGLDDFAEMAKARGACCRALRALGEHRCFWCASEDEAGS